MSAFALRIVRELTELGTRTWCCVSKAVTFLFRSLRSSTRPSTSDFGSGCCSDVVTSWGRAAPC